jgi:hypothetical protein
MHAVRPVLRLSFMEPELRERLWPVGRRLTLLRG